jgi:transcriptional regulator with XRE-family HTH domain
LGQRLREAREQQRISLRTLAKRIDVSASLVSQVERGNVTPSVGTLYAIVRELNLSMDELFSEAEAEGAGARRAQSGPVQRSDTRKTIYLASGVRWELLTSKHDPELEFQMATYEVGAESCPADALMTHGGKEYGYVISGRLEVTIGTDVYILDPGDAVSFSSMTPHRLANAGDEIVEALWVVVGREADARLRG